MPQKTMLTRYTSWGPPGAQTMRTSTLTPSDFSQTQKLFSEGVEFSIDEIDGSLGQCQISTDSSCMRRSIEWWSKLTGCDPGNLAESDSRWLDRNSHKMEEGKYAAAPERGLEA